MDNGIIINGVKYEAVETQTRNGCNGCAFEVIGGCLKPTPCSSFRPLDVIFVKLKDPHAITKEEAAKRIANYAMNNPEKFFNGDAKEVVTEINRLL